MDSRPIGVVSSSVERATEYLNDVSSPYVIIRTVADVPERLGGLALLDDEPVPLELAQALSRALLNEE